MANKFDFAADSITVNGKTFPARYEVTAAAVNVFATVTEDGKEKTVCICIEAGNELYGPAALAAVKEAPEVQQTEEEAQAKRRVFPLITKELQKEYEEVAKEGDYIPTICGVCGRACRQMGKDEGANRANCASCALAKYCEKAEEQQVVTEAEQAEEKAQQAEPEAEQAEEEAQAEPEAEQAEEAQQTEEAEQAAPEVERAAPEAEQTAPEAEQAAPDPKAARGPVPEKTFIGQSITGAGWAIIFDGAHNRTRVIISKGNHDKLRGIVESAGFYYSAALDSWNRKLTFRAYRAAQALAQELTAACAA